MSISIIELFKALLVLKSGTERIFDSNVYYLRFLLKIHVDNGGGHWRAMLETCNFENIGKSFGKCKQKRLIVSVVPALNFLDSVSDLIG